jgi:hypothetical protein
MNGTRVQQIQQPNTRGGKVAFLLLHLTDLIICRSFALNFNCAVDWRTLQNTNSKLKNATFNDISDNYND